MFIYTQSCSYMITCIHIYALGLNMLFMFTTLPYSVKTGKRDLIGKKQVACGFFPCAVLYCPSDGILLQSVLAS